MVFDAVRLSPSAILEQAVEHLRLWRVRVPPFESAMSVWSNGVSRSCNMGSASASTSPLNS